MQARSISALDALPYQSAVLDPMATVVSVNESWRRFARDNGGSAAVIQGTGYNYLAVCRQATGRHAEDASMAERAIREILQGSTPRVAFAYPCPSPSVDGSFLFTATAIPGPHIGVFISHIDMRDGATPSQTPRIAGEKYVLEEAASTLRRELALHQDAQSMTATGAWELDPALRTFHWTREAYRIHDVRPEGFTPTMHSILQFYRQKDREHLEVAFTKAEHFGLPFDLELPARSATGRRFWIRFICKVESHGSRRKRLYGAFQDISRYQFPARPRTKNPAGRRR